MSHAIQVQALTVTEAKQLAKEIYTGFTQEVLNRDDAAICRSLQRMVDLTRQAAREIHDGAALKSFYEYSVPTTLTMVESCQLPRL